MKEIEKTEKRVHEARQKASSSFSPLRVQDLWSAPLLDALVAPSFSFFSISIPQTRVRPQMNLMIVPCTADSASGFGTVVETVPVKEQASLVIRLWQWLINYLISWADCLRRSELPGGGTFLSSDSCTESILNGDQQFL